MLFLPPLLFETAQRTSWAVVRARRKTLLMLAFDLTAVTALVAAGNIWALIRGCAFPKALALGAAIVRHRTRNSPQPNHVRRRYLRS